MSLRNELNRGDGVIVGEQWSMAIAEIQTPDFDVSITGTSDHKTTIGWDIETEDRLSMSV